MGLSLVLRRGGAFGPLLRRRKASSIPPYLNDPDALVGDGVTVNSATADTLSYTTTLGASAYYSVPAPPVGSVIEFDITSDRITYLRVDLEGDGTSPNYNELVPGGVPTGPQHVSVTIPNIADRPWLCFKHASNANTQITNWRVTAPVVPEHPLQPYFDSGAIVIYLDSDGATLNGSGEVTAIANRGAGGAAFNASVSGNPIPLTGNTMQMSSSTGNCIMATPASIDGVRLMWVASAESLANFMRFFGSANDEVRLGTAVDGTFPLQLWSNRSGSGAAASSTPRLSFPASGLHLMELETNLTAKTGQVFLDGASASAFSGIGHTAFTVDRIGQGTGATLQFVGRMGGVLGVITGRPDTAAAITAARSYWAARFGLVLS